VLVADCILLRPSDDICSIVSTKQNAAKATYRGAEAQLTILPTDELMINVGYGYVDPEYKKWPDIDRAGNPVDKSDTIFFFQPDHELNASIRYTLPIKQDIGDLSVMANVSWRDDMIMTVDPKVLANPAYKKHVVQDAYHILDMRFDWKRFMGSPMDFSLFVNNLNNKTYVVSASDQLKDNRNLFMTHIYGEPRTYGASVRYSF
jgi:iron complex outermembrane recepter protein